MEPLSSPRLTGTPFEWDSNEVVLGGVTLMRDEEGWFTLENTTDVYPSEENRQKVLSSLLEFAGKLIDGSRIAEALTLQSCITQFAQRELGFSEENVLAMYMENPIAMKLELMRFAALPWEVENFSNGFKLTEKTFDNEQLLSLYNEGPVELRDNVFPKEDLNDTRMNYYKALAEYISSEEVKERFLKILSQTKDRQESDEHTEACYKDQHTKVRAAQMSLASGIPQYALQEYLMLNRSVRPF